jgi:hypothetical protein
MVIDMQYSLKNDNIYENMFILLRENGYQMIHLSHISIVEILEHGTCKDVCML